MNLGPLLPRLAFGPLLTGPAGPNRPPSGVGAWTPTAVTHTPRAVTRVGDDAALVSESFLKQASVRLIGGAAGWGAQ